MTAAVSGYGIAVSGAAGWDVRIFRRPTTPPETTHAVLHAATFAIPELRGDYGDGAVQLMSAADAFVALVEFEPAATSRALFAHAGFPPPFVPTDFSRTTLQHAMGGQVGLQRFFSAQRRAWCIYVVVGSKQITALAPRVNDLIGGISVMP